ncbi:MAG TPA: T9SS type A sorting domain-containing protein, partial [Bacteroidia bacterium]|nr:T9SS type A sorting domain-containing protein [Bacteroidia bacterium]
TDVVTVSPNWDCPRNRMANPDLSDSTGSFLFYPNPSNGQITVEGATEGQQIVVVSPDGRTVLEKPATGTTQVLDLSELAAGLYFIRITNNEGISVAEQKIILQ